MGEDQHDTPARSLATECVAHPAVEQHKVDPGWWFRRAGGGVSAGAVVVQPTGFNPQNGWLVAGDGIQI